MFKYLDKTYIYSYNEIGNITSVEECSYTTGTESGSYSSKDLVYGDASNPDRLTRYGYNDISYDSNGYPVRYGDMILAWDRGKLVKMYEDVDESSCNSKETYEFKYNAYGQRISKIYEYDPGPDYSGDFLIGYDTTYTYDDSGRLIREDREEYYTESASITYKTFYLYDQSDIIGFTIKRDDIVIDTYYFNKNIHGDVTEIYNSSGSAVVKYAYDAFGNCATLSSSDPLANNLNSIRYRSYYYDSDTKLYYLNARYYSPEWRRFISPDSTEYLDPETPNGLNLYIYCNNDPVNYADPSGNFGIWALIAIAAASMLIGGTAQLISNAVAGKTDSELWRGVVGAAVGTSVNALALCLAIPTGGTSLFIAAGAGAIAQTGVDMLETIIRSEEIDFVQTFIDLGLNFVTALVGNYFGGKIIPTNPGWFQPRKFLSVFTKSYGKKILLQTAIGAGLSGVINFTRKNDWDKYKPIIPMPVGPIYPLL